MNVVYVTGNAHKAKYFSEMVGLDIPHEPADTAEIQSLDIDEVIIAKAKEAYAQLKRPLIVEDTFFTLPVMGRLPGTLIKWFLEELGPEGICRLADRDPERKAVVGATFCYYDGQDMTFFKGQLTGTVPASPRGSSGFGWNVDFIPDGQLLSLAEMDDVTFKDYYSQIKPFAELKKFLQSLN